MEDKGTRGNNDSSLAGALTLNHDDLSGFLKKVATTKTDPSKKVLCDFYMVRCSEDEPLESDFVNKVSGFVVPYSLKKRQYSDASPEDYLQLVKGARMRFTGSDNSGEIGEVILYALLECERNAPQVLNKMALKTDPKKQFSGLDAIHIGIDDDIVNIYYGESKVWADCKAAVNDAVSDLTRFDTTPDRERYELDLVDANIDLEKFKGVEELLKDYISPYRRTNPERFRKTYSVFIGSNWSSIAHIDPSTVVQDLERVLEDGLKNGCDDFYDHCTKKVESSKIRKPFEFFVIPFEDVEKIREMFKKALS